MLQQKLAGLGQPAVTMPMGMRSVDPSHGAASSSTTSPPASSAEGYHAGLTSVACTLHASPVRHHRLVLSCSLSITSGLVTCMFILDRRQQLHAEPSADGIAGQPGSHAARSARGNAQRGMKHVARQPVLGPLTLQCKPRRSDSALAFTML